MIKISFIPFEWKENKYISLVKRIYEKIGFQDVKYSLWDNNILFVALNDYEGLPKGIIKSKIQYVLRYIGLVIIKLKKQKIIWTVHDVQPHYTVNKNLSESLRNQIMKQDPIVIIHSNLTRRVFENKYPNFNTKSNMVYFPHPNYINEYGLELPKVTSNNELVILFMGLINTYKNLDLLIKCVNKLGKSNIKLIIRGSIKDDQKDYYTTLCEGNPNIDFQFGFVPDNEIPELFSKSHLLITPYDLEVSLNSGANILAFSYGTTVLGVDNGTLQDIPDKSLFFGYQYKDKQTHEETLYFELNEIYSKYAGKYNKLNLLGKNMKSYVYKNYSIESISEQLDKNFIETNKSS